MSEVLGSNPGRNILVTISNVLGNHSSVGLTVSNILIRSRGKHVLHFVEPGLAPNYDCIDSHHALMNN